LRGIFELLFGDICPEAVERRVVLERVPRDRIVAVAETQEAAELITA
jgi:hypothetical protein